jgi:hypothetical protein
MVILASGVIPQTTHIDNPRALPHIRRPQHGSSLRLVYDCLVTGFDEALALAD